MYGKLKQELKRDLTNIKKEGLYKDERVIMTPHIAGLSKESNQKLSKLLVNKILELK